MRRHGVLYLPFVNALGGMTKVKVAAVIAVDLVIGPGLAEVTARIEIVIVIETAPNPGTDGPQAGGAAVTGIGVGIVSQSSAVSGHREGVTRRLQLPVRLATKDLLALATGITCTSRIPRSSPAVSSRRLASSVIRPSQMHSY